MGRSSRGGEGEVGKCVKEAVSAVVEQFQTVQEVSRSNGSLVSVEGSEESPHQVG